jgi:quinate dehydrogenase
LVSIATSIFFSIMGSLEAVRNKLYIAGAQGGSSIGPRVHERIGHHLGKDWTMTFLECRNVEEVISIFRQPEFTGGVVTMPWKQAIIPLLDDVDDIVLLTGACNLVFLTEAGRLRGTNVDWVGIEAPLVQARAPRKGDVGMIYGAGGASRAGLYAMVVRMGLETIYIANRDDQEIQQFLRDAQGYKTSHPLTIVPVRTTKAAATLPVPAYIVSTIPDIEPSSESELRTRDVLCTFLRHRGESRSVLLDMCYHPRQTANLRLADDAGWETIDGVETVARQFRAHWKHWTGVELSDDIEQDARGLLDKIAEADPTVGPDQRCRDPS